ncbi:hypothetical protein MKW92_022932, partial [Papaver armeniacum]
LDMAPHHESMGTYPLNSKPVQQVHHAYSVETTCESTCLFTTWMAKLHMQTFQ